MSLSGRCRQERLHEPSTRAGGRTAVGRAFFPILATLPLVFVTASWVLLAVQILHTFDDTTPVSLGPKTSLLTSICTGDPEACITAQHTARNCQIANEHAANTNEFRMAYTMQPHQEGYNRVARQITVSASQPLPRIFYVIPTARGLAQHYSVPPYFWIGARDPQNSSLTAHAKCIQQRETMQPSCSPLGVAAGYKRARHIGICGMLVGYLAVASSMLCCDAGFWVSWADAGQQ